MAWGEAHAPANGGTGTTGQIETANRALDKLNVRPGPLALRVLELVDRHEERWVCPPCRRGEHVETYHLVGVDVGDRAVCVCEVCDV